MQRREFIINSAVALAGSALLAGCNKTKLIESENKVVWRKYKDIEVPLIALGCMRLPMKNNEVDQKELDSMVEYCINHGANYFDTAYMYVEEKSELAIGKALKKYNRKDFLLADKSPIYKMKTKEDVRRIFDEQLKKCQVDYFDFYMCHNINKNTFETYRNVEMADELKKLKKEGKIKYLGFLFMGLLKF